MAYFIGIGDKQYRVEDDGSVRTMDGKPADIELQADPMQDIVEELIPSIPDEQPATNGLCTESSMKVILKRRRITIRRRRKLTFKPMENK